MFEGKTQNDAAQSKLPQDDTLFGHRRETGTPDGTYGLIRTCQILLQGAETAARFVRDARAEGKEELAEFFEETREEFVSRAERAKELLLECLDEE